MRTPLQCVAMSIAAMVALSGSRTVVMAAHGQSVVVLVDDRAQVPPWTMDQAAKEAARIYRHAHVKLEWRALPDPRGAASSNGLVTSPGDFTVRLIVQARFEGATGAPSQFVLGAAPSLALGCGGIVYLFFDQVMGMARVQRVASALVFGTAVAHEIGHVLLGRGHSNEGLMRASWKADDWQRATMGLLLFSPPEGQTMRSAISSCR